MDAAGLFLSAWESEAWGSPTSVGGGLQQPCCVVTGPAESSGVCPLPPPCTKLGVSGREGWSPKAPGLSVKEWRRLSSPPSLTAPVVVGSDCGGLGLEG